MVERVTQLPHARRQLSSAVKGATKERFHVHGLQVSPRSEANNVIRFETHHLGIVTPPWHGPHLLQKQRSRNASKASMMMRRASGEMQEKGGLPFHTQVSTIPVAAEGRHRLVRLFIQWERCYSYWLGLMKSSNSELIHEKPETLASLHKSTRVKPRCQVSTKLSELWAYCVSNLWIRRVHTFLFKKRLIICASDAHLITFKTGLLIALERCIWQGS